MAVMPAIARRLKRLLPITLPTAIALLPRSTATIEVATSGNEVPMATSVKPMTTSGTPKARASSDAASTSHCAPRTRPPRPTRRPSRSTQIVRLGSVASGSSDSTVATFVVTSPAYTTSRRAARMLRMVTPTKQANSSSPSMRSMLTLKYAMPTKRMETAVKSGSSRRTKPAATGSAAMRPAMPKMRPRLAMLLPTILPMAMSPASPLSAAVRLMTSSGILVPKATMVRPMMTGGRWNRTARREAARTRNSAPPTSSTNPPKNLRASRSRFMAVNSFLPGETCGGADVRLTEIDGLSRQLHLVGQR